MVVSTSDGWTRLCGQLSEYARRVVNYALNNGEAGKASWFALLADFWMDASRRRTVEEAVDFRSLAEQHKSVAQITYHVAPVLAEFFDGPENLYGEMFRRVPPYLEALFPQQMAHDEPLPAAAGDPFSQVVLDAVRRLESDAEQSALKCGCSSCRARLGDVRSWISGIGQ